MTEGNRIEGDVQRKAAAYARQPTVWTAAPPPATPSVVRSAVAVARALTGVAALTVVPPVLLMLVFGPPAKLLPSWAAVVGFFADERRQTAPALLVPAAGVLLWLLWALLMVLLAGSLLRVVAGWRIRRWRLPAGLHRMLFGLAGSAAVAIVTTPHSAGAAPASPAGIADQGGSYLRQQTVTVLVGEERFEYAVKRGDTLSKIARRWLGDADRWPEICRLNKHRHVTGRARLTDCDLIRPGWQLRLPADARPPQTTRPKPPPRHESRPAAPEPSATATPTPPSSFTAPPTSSASGTETAPDSAPTGDDQPQTSVGEDGIRLPSGSLIPWTLATAISAAAGLVWLQRRRRHQPQPGAIGNLPAPALPAPVPTIQRHARQVPDRPAPTPWLPDGLIGVNGPGAAGVVRGMLVTALTTGADDPHSRTEVIVDRDTLTELLGTDTSGWPRLHISRDFTDSLRLIDTQLLHRARILDEYDTADLAAVRAQAPHEEALPPLLLIGRARDAAGSHVRVTFGLARGVDITAALLGDWPHGPTHTITADGRPTDDQPALPGALAVIERADAVALLDTVREAHTGEPATTVEPAPTTPVTPRTGDEAGTRTRASLRVLGTPRVENLTRPGNNLRAKAAELAVFLACHPDGATTETVAEHLLPDVRRSQAGQQVHTNASNLRHVLGRAAGPIPGGYVLKRGANARYRLDADTVDIDVWRLRDLLRRAQLTSAPARTALLREACELYTAPLAHGCDYEWIEPHRVQVRRWGTEAHLLLAEDLLATDPQAARDVLDKAIELDPYSEELYRHAMRTRHALGDIDGIRTLLRAVTTAVGELGAAPQEATITLANRLRAETTGSPNVHRRPEQRGAG